MNLTFDEAQKSCQQNGGELVRDLAFLRANIKGISSIMTENKMVSAWVGKPLFPFKYGLYYSALGLIFLKHYFPIQIKCKLRLRIIIYTWNCHVLHNIQIGVINAYVLKEYA